MCWTVCCVGVWGRPLSGERSVLCVLITLYINVQIGSCSTFTSTVHCIGQSYNALKSQNLRYICLFLLLLFSAHTALLHSEYGLSPSVGPSLPSSAQLVARPPDPEARDVPFRQRCNRVSPTKQKAISGVVVRALCLRTLRLTGFNLDSIWIQFPLQTNNNDQDKKKLHLTVGEEGKSSADQYLVQQRHGYHKSNNIWSTIRRRLSQSGERCTRQ